MREYTITITSNGGASAKGAQTVVRVDASGRQPKVTEVTTKGGTGGLAPAELPNVDIELLIQAVTAPKRPLSAVESTVPASSRPRGRAASSRAATRTPAKRTSRATATKATKATTATKRTAAKATRGAAGRGATATRGTRGAAATKSTSRATRAYRRMPEPAELLSALKRAGSITGLARDYDIPRHTAQGWITRARRMGAMPGGR